MKRIIIFGNSGSGKSTLAKKYQNEGLSHLDLDTIAWEMNPDPVRKSLNKSKALIDEFLNNNQSWVIEGCYSDLLEIVSKEATEAIFMNLSVEQCIANAKARPWEPHKYESKEAQDENLAMLIDWIKQYETRDDTFSYKAHQALFQKFKGEKKMVQENN